MLDKHYNHADVEQRLYDLWERDGCFAAGANAKPGAETYCIVIPPPNVTGSLHMGHALNNTLQDILIRWKRMQGYDVLWQPGTDHAGIATQMVVERQMMERQEPGRRDIGREAFLEKVWAWKEESGNTITGQLRRLGASCDWSRERFTMDEGLSQAVLKVFVELHKNGLIYRDKRLVNWDPKLLTAISDLEVEQTPAKGHLWHFKYPVEGEEGCFLTVATTRPETMLGDTAVAVNAEDTRYLDLIGKMVHLPLVDRMIPVVADEHADPEVGSGAVKITPAHDFNDFEVGKRHDLQQLNVLDEHAHIVIGEEADAAKIPDKYRGLERIKARKAVVADIEALGLLAEVEDHEHTLPYGDRSNVVIEPRLTDQWYVDAATLAKPAIAAVENGDTVFVPKTWEKTYFDWMRNIQPWCVSRQLWWGHQIPAWYGPDGTVFVEDTEAEALAAAEKHYGAATELTRDEDVLDTWFSSALWPFSTLGWPERTSELSRYYPTSVLVTGFDIIFFWVARMMMYGLHFMKDGDGKSVIPFHDVYIHALVRDEKGAKMSKAKGNVIDPLELIGEYGADSLRFTLAAMAAQGRDIKLAKSRVEGYRNFGTKVWNAVNFALKNDARRIEKFDPGAATLTLNKWIIDETANAAASVDRGLAEYKFNEAAGAAYRFTWNVLCDWYIEFSKPALFDGDDAENAETRATLAWVIDQTLKLLHPFMPFITEEIWQQTDGEGWLMHADWPLLDDLENEAAAGELNWVIRVIEEIRSVRAEMNVPGGAKIPMLMKGADEKTTLWLTRHKGLMSRQARLDSIGTTDADVEGAVQTVLDDVTILLLLGDIIDFSAEAARLEKDLKKSESETGGLKARLANEKFLAKAPEDVVSDAKEQLSEAEAKATKLRDALKRLRKTLDKDKK